jgi:hypothetical protein
MKLWTALLHKVPTTPEKVEYGTPEMAYAVRGLFDNTDVLKKKIFVMAGHVGGVVAFGKDLRSAFAQLTEERKNLKVESRKAEVGIKEKQELKIKKAQLVRNAE